MHHSNAQKDQLRIAWLSSHKLTVEHRPLLPDGMKTDRPWWIAFHEIKINPVRGKTLREAIDKARKAEMKLLDQLIRLAESRK